MLFTVRLPRGSFNQVAILIQLSEDVLRDVFLLLRRSSAEDIETYLKPLIYVCMDFFVFVT